MITSIQAQKTASHGQAEKKLQNELVMWFSQTYPYLRGCLFEVNNTVTNINHLSSRRGMGMFYGVSDLILFVNGVFCGIELKAPGSVHSSAKVQRQLEWGNIIRDNGGIYIISSDVTTLKNFIEHIIYKRMDYATDLCIDPYLSGKTFKF